MSLYICLDLGGTAVKYGVADEEGVFRLSKEEASEASAGKLPYQAERLVRGLCRENSIAGIAVSTAGAVNTQRGEIIYAAEHFPGYTGTKLAALLNRVSGLPCTVENDVNCAALGEYWLGAGQKEQAFFCLTVGTGIGGCAVLKGQVVQGAASCAGEVGYLPINEAQTLEEAACVRTLTARVAAAKGLLPDEVDGRQVLDWAKAGEPAAQEAVEALLSALARGMAMISYVCDPGLFILGGGIMAQEAYIRPRLTEKLLPLILPPARSHTRLAFARCGNGAGMLGALYYFLQRHKKL